MATIKAFEFSTAEIDGLVFEFQIGILEVSTDATGVHTWKATAYYRTVSPELDRISSRGEVRVEFDMLMAGRFAGQAFVTATLSKSPGAVTYVQIQGTGPLEGWVER